MCATLPFSLNKKKKQNNHPKNMLVIACFIRTFKITKYTVKKKTTTIITLNMQKI